MFQDFISGNYLPALDIAADLALWALNLAASTPLASIKALIHRPFSFVPMCR